MSDFKIKLDAELKGDAGQTIQSQLDKLGLKINLDYNNVDTNKIQTLVKQKPPWML